MSWRRHCSTAADTQRAGEEFARLLRQGDVVLLEGQLGAGKTTFTQGVARGLGVSERVTSPTFTVVRQHDCNGLNGIVTLHHADVYRVEHLGEVLDLALGELVEEQAVALVEWGELAASVFGSDVLTMTFRIEDDEARTLTVAGELAQSRSEELRQWCAQ
jgi:tRNA threonylcarbamoyladenosine biosynthesis protein TsaE